LGDDLDAYYIDMKQVDRNQFIQYLKQLDDTITSEAYLGAFFEPKSEHP
jgi:hypothetical protein